MRKASRYQTRHSLVQLRTITIVVCRLSPFDLSDPNVSARMVEHGETADPWRICDEVWQPL